MTANNRQDEGRTQHAPDKGQSSADKGGFKKKPEMVEPSNDPFDQHHRGETDKTRDKADAGKAAQPNRKPDRS